MKPLRPLTASEVEFSIEVEPEDIPLEGNCMATDDEADRTYEAEIRNALESGVQEAWCCLVVKATWESPSGKEWVGSTSLGCVTLNLSHQSGASCERQAWETANLHGMKAEALADLNAQLLAYVQGAGVLNRELASCRDNHPSR